MTRSHPARPLHHTTTPRGRRSPDEYRREYGWLTSRSDQTGHRRVRTNRRRSIDTRTTEIAATHGDHLGVRIVRIVWPERRTHLVRHRADQGGPTRRLSDESGRGGWSLLQLRHWAAGTADELRLLSIFLIVCTSSVAGAFAARFLLTPHHCRTAWLHSCRW
jgi:hypothetical protein